MLASAVADASKQSCLTEAQARHFHEKGFLVVKNLISREELNELRDETRALLEQRNTGADYWYNDGMPDSWYNNYKEGSAELATPSSPVKKGVPFRVEYPIDKSGACKSLIAHPFLLKSMEMLLGPNFIPTWDSLVFKNEGEGVPIKWHRDASAESVGVAFKNFNPKDFAQNEQKSIFPPPIDVGIYLDPATVAHGNCIYVIPASNHFPDFLASSMISHLTDNGFRTSGSIPVEVEAGDMIMHNILVLHGSPACASPLRRTVYYEFRAAEQELKMGPHAPKYIPLKQQMLAACLKHRQQKYPQEDAFTYKPSDRFPFSDEPISSFRFPHEDYFLKTYKG